MDQGDVSMIPTRSDGPRRDNNMETGPAPSPEHFNKNMPDSKHKRGYDNLKDELFISALQNIRSHNGHSPRNKYPQAGESRSISSASDQDVSAQSHYVRPHKAAGSASESPCTLASYAYPTAPTFQASAGGSSETFTDPPSFGSILRRAQPTIHPATTAQPSPLCSSVASQTRPAAPQPTSFSYARAASTPFPAFCAETQQALPVPNLVLHHNDIGSVSGDSDVESSVHLRLYTEGSPRADKGASGHTPLSPLTIVSSSPSPRLPLDDTRLTRPAFPTINSSSSDECNTTHARPQSQTYTHAMEPLSDTQDTMVCFDLLSELHQPQPSGRRELLYSPSTRQRTIMGPTPTHLGTSMTRRRRISRSMSAVQPSNSSQFVAALRAEEPLGGPPPSPFTMAMRERSDADCYGFSLVPMDCAEASYDGRTYNAAMPGLYGSVSASWPLPDATPGPHHPSQMVPHDRQGQQHSANTAGHRVDGRSTLPRKSSKGGGAAQVGCFGPAKTREKDSKAPRDQTRRPEFGVEHCTTLANSIVPRSPFINTDPSVMHSPLADLQASQYHGIYYDCTHNAGQPYHRYHHPQLKETLSMPNPSSGELPPQYLEPRRIPSAPSAPATMGSPGAMPAVPNKSTLTYLSLTDPDGSPLLSDTSIPSPCTTPPSHSSFLMSHHAATHLYRHCSTDEPPERHRLRKCTSMIQHTYEPHNQIPYTPMAAGARNTTPNDHAPLHVFSQNYPSPVPWHSTPPQHWNADATNIQPHWSYHQTQPPAYPPHQYCSQLSASLSGPPGLSSLLSKTTSTLTYAPLLDTQEDPTAPRPSTSSASIPRPTGPSDCLYRTSVDSANSTSSSAQARTSSMSMTEDRAPPNMHDPHTNTIDQLTSPLPSNGSSASPFNDPIASHLLALDLNPPQQTMGDVPLQGTLSKHTTSNDSLRYNRLSQGTNSTQHDAAAAMHGDKRSGEPAVRRPGDTHGDKHSLEPARCRRSTDMDGDQHSLEPPSLRPMVVEFSLHPEGTPCPPEPHSPSPVNLAHQLPTPFSGEGACLAFQIVAQSGMPPRSSDVHNSGVVRMNALLDSLPKQSPSRGEMNPQLSSQSGPLPTTSSKLQAGPSSTGSGQLLNNGVDVSLGPVSRGPLWARNEGAQPSERERSARAAVELPRTASQPGAAHDLLAYLHDPRLREPDFFTATFANCQTADARTLQPWLVSLGLLLSLGGVSTLIYLAGWRGREDQIDHVEFHSLLDELLKITNSFCCQLLNHGLIPADNAMEGYLASTTAVSSAAGVVHDVLTRFHHKWRGKVGPGALQQFVRDKASQFFPSDHWFSVGMYAALVGLVLDDIVTPQRHLLSASSVT